MNDDPNREHKRTGRVPGAARLERDRRRAAALRENLRKRKDQSRERRDSPRGPRTPADPE